MLCFPGTEQPYWLLDFMSRLLLGAFTDFSPKRVLEIGFTLSRNGRCLIFSY